MSLLVTFWGVRGSIAKPAPILVDTVATLRVSKSKPVTPSS